MDLGGGTRTVGSQFEVCIKWQTVNATYFKPRDLAAKRLLVRIPYGQPRKLIHSNGTEKV